MSILELFCSVDDFWLQFAPGWQASLLSTGQRHRARATQMHPSAHDDHSHLVPRVALPHLQSLLYRLRPGSLM